MGSNTHGASVSFKDVPEICPFPPESRFPTQIAPIIHALFGLFCMYFRHLWLRYNRHDTWVFTPVSKVYFLLVWRTIAGIFSIFGCDTYRWDTSVPPFSKVFFFFLLFEAQMPGFSAFMVDTYRSDTSVPPFSKGVFLIWSTKCRNFLHLWFTHMIETLR